MKLFSAIRTKEIELLCLEEDWGVIPEPYPARKHMPDWYKALPPMMDGKTKLLNATLKRCPPFLDALSLGWIIPLAADVEFISNEDASGINYKWEFCRPMVENHLPAQISTEAVPNPECPKPPMKFLNWWMIKVPKGYDLLFMPPMNRRDERFECLSGLVRGEYREYINFPFFFRQKNYTGVLRAGTPLVQVIPIKRDTVLEKSKTRKIEGDFEKEVELTRRRRKSHPSYYRDNLWRAK